jgi:MerR family regulatory protein
MDQYPSRRVPRTDWRGCQVRITQLASELGVSSDWLRRLERAGAIPKAQRDRNGHRRFSTEDVARLKALIFEEPTADKRDEGAEDA